MTVTTENSQIVKLFAPERLVMPVMNLKDVVAAAFVAGIAEFAQGPSPFPPPCRRVDVLVVIDHPRNRLRARPLRASRLLRLRAKWRRWTTNGERSQDATAEPTRRRSRRHRLELISTVATGAPQVRHSRDSVLCALRALHSSLFSIRLERSLDSYSDRATVCFGCIWRPTPPLPPSPIKGQEQARKMWVARAPSCRAV